MKRKKTSHRDQAQCDIKGCAARYGESYAHAVDLGWQATSFFGLAVLLCPYHRREDIAIASLKVETRKLALKETK